MSSEALLQEYKLQSGIWDEMSSELGFRNQYSTVINGLKHFDIAALQ